MYKKIQAASSKSTACIVKGINTHTVISVHILDRYIIS